LLATLVTLTLVAAASLAPSTFADQPGSLVSATVTRVGNDFLISWTTTGEVKKVKIDEGTLHQRYGSFENYANQALGISAAQLGQIRANLLEK